MSIMSVKLNGRRSTARCTDAAAQNVFENIERELNRLDQGLRHANQQIGALKRQRQEFIAALRAQQQHSAFAMGDAIAAAMGQPA